MCASFIGLAKCWGVIPSGLSSPAEAALVLWCHVWWRSPYTLTDRASPTRRPPHPHPTCSLLREHTLLHSCTITGRGERWRSRLYLACWGRRTSLYFCCFCLSWIWAQGEILHYDSAWRNQTADPACKHTLIHWNTVGLHSISK